MSRSVIALFIASVLVASPGFAQFVGGGMVVTGMQQAPSWPSQRWSVKVETAAGKTLSGTLTLKDVAVGCDFGVYHIKPENVKAIRFAGNGGEQVIVGPQGVQVQGAVLTGSGEEIGGTVLVPSWTVETELGQVVLNPGGLRSVTLTGKAAGGDRAAEERKVDAPIEKK